MKLFLISQDENDEYDTFDSMVVAAETEDDARLITPYANYKWSSDLLTPWASSPDKVSVELIGTAIEGTKAGIIILASFNAG